MKGQMIEITIYLTVQVAQSKGEGGQGAMAPP
jgi:hypothetical protein